MRDARQHRIDRAILRTLSNCGNYLLPDSILRDEISLLVVPSPTTGELDNSIGYLDTGRLITGVLAETGKKWKLSDGGRAWLAENP